MTNSVNMSGDFATLGSFESGPGYFVIINGSRVSEYFDKKESAQFAVDFINAAFIVHAVNAHKEMLEMLYALLPCAEESDEFNKPSGKLAPKVRALIAKAEGGK